LEIDCCSIPVPVDCTGCLRRLVFGVTLTNIDKKLQATHDCVLWTTDIGVEYGDVRPLNKNRRRALDVNSPVLAELIDSDEMFVAKLYTAGCITRSQREHLMNIPNQRDRNAELLGFFTRRSVADFNKFLKCIIDGNMTHVVDLLATDGGEIFYSANHKYCDCND